jgi:integrase
MVEVEDDVNGERVRRERYVGLGFHDLCRANATELLAAGVDIKTAQTWLGHSEARLTLDLYAQAVTELGEAAARRMGAKFLPMWGEPAMDSGEDGDDT